MSACLDYSLWPRDLLPCPGWNKSARGDLDMLDAAVGANNGFMLTKHTQDTHTRNTCAGCCGGRKERFHVKKKTHTRHTHTLALDAAVGAKRGLISRKHTHNCAGCCSRRKDRFSIKKTHTHTVHPSHGCWLPSPPFPSRTRSGRRRATEHGSADHRGPHGHLGGESGPHRAAGQRGRAGRCRFHERAGGAGG